ncbi:MAG TPA: YdbH domain-containing protein [Sphingobium sp.]|nr:YdbH domain-containing protein [Sphingobium sp.]
MDDPADNERADRRVRRLRRARRIGGGAAILLALGVGGLWLARKPIADSFIAGELAKRGVQGRYQITRIGPRTQRLEHLVIGDPARPDLTVRLVEVDIGWGLTGARIARVQASGVRLRGRFHDGALDLGQVSRLLEGGGGEAELPDWRVQIDDARADIDSDYGPLVATMDGSGPLRSGFIGTLGLSAPSFTAGDCTLDRLIAPMDLSTERGQIVIDGPIQSRALACEGAGMRLTMPRLKVNLRGDLAFKAVSGAVTFNADGAQQAQRRLGPLTGLLTFKGSGEDLRGSAALSTLQASGDGVAMGTAKLGGNFALRPGGRERALAWQGDATVEDISPADGVNLTGLMRAAMGTPLEPLARKLADAVVRIGKDNRLVLAGKLNMIGTRGNASLDTVGLTSASGAHIATTPGSVARVQWPDGGTRAAGTLTIAGGGLPEGRITLASDAGGRILGTATLAAYRAGSARLALSPVQFSLGGPGAGQLRTQVTLDGPLPDGALTGLTVPIDARLLPDGGIRLAQDCAPVRWQALHLSGMALHPGNLRLCGIAEGRLEVGSLALTGTVGDSPLALSATSAHYGLADGRFEISAPSVQTGDPEAPVRFAALGVAGGRTESGALAGTITGGVGRIGTVPLDLSDIAGPWTFTDGKLTLDGSLQVSDTQADRRFNPLAGRDVHLTFADGRIDATGTLVHPGRNAAVAAVTIRHVLASGAGQAVLKLDHLTFGRALQPDDLTPLALGVVANVTGVVEGEGLINWTGDTVTSKGLFSTRDMSLAAAFGPVEGLSTTIRFTDLLGMRTAPGQVVTLATVNPGIEVHDGVIRYALLSSEQAVIESGHWPFSGGDLDLLPTTLELDARKPRQLTFRVVGLDAGAFINTLELDNISATGTFDGLLPMIFDATGGRIDGGLLVARQQGDPPLILSSTAGLDVPCDAARQAGNLSYIGDVSNADLNMFSKLAFDALKNLRYRCLAIMLDGALDGEFVTRLSVNGINQGTEEARKSFIARPFLGLPFVFNVRIEAPFRGLLSTAAGLTDPTVAIHNSLSEQFDEAARDGVAVQPPDSDKK